MPTYAWVGSCDSTGSMLKTAWTINLEDSISYLSEKNFRSIWINNPALQLDHTCLGVCGSN